MDSLYDLDEAYSIAERLYEELNLPELAGVLVHMRRAWIYRSRVIHSMKEALFLARGVNIPAAKEGSVYMIKEFINDLKSSYRTVLKNVEEFEKVSGIAASFIEKVRMKVEKGCASGKPEFCEARRELLKMVEIWTKWTVESLEDIKKNMKELETLLDTGSLRDIEEALDRLKEDSKAQREEKGGIFSKIKSFLSRKPPEEREGDQGDVA